MAFVSSFTSIFPFKPLALPSEYYWPLLQSLKLRPRQVTCPGTEAVAPPPSISFQRPPLLGSSPHHPPDKVASGPLLSVPPHPGPHLMLPSVEAHSTLRGGTPKAGARAPQALSPPGPNLQLESPREFEGRQEAREGGWKPIPGAKARPPAPSVPLQPVCGWMVKKLTCLPSRNPL